MPTTEIAKLEESYQTGQIQGPLICDIGYPKVAPGVIEDPTGATFKANLSIGEMVSLTAAKETEKHPVPLSHAWSQALVPAFHVVYEK